MEPYNDELADKLGISRTAKLKQYDLLIAGRDLADRITRQAEKYGVEILQAVSVNNIERRDSRIDATLSTGEVIEAKAVLIATGSTYRRTGASGESELIGAGIYFYWFRSELRFRKGLGRTR